MKEIRKARHISEAGENPALCLSNRDIYERAGCHWRNDSLWEGAQVGWMIQSVDLPGALIESVF